MVTLYVNYYKDKSATRQDEIDTTLMMNYYDESIDRIVVIGEPGIKLPNHYIPKKSDKIEMVYLPTRPTFDDFFLEIAAREKSYPGIHIIANSDIFFDKSLSKLTRITEKNLALAISRDDIDKHALQRDVTWSQDAWVLWSRPAIEAPFHLGKRGCDNKMAWLLKNAGLRVYDLRDSITLRHNHASAVRNYSTKGDEDLVPKPYAPVPLAALQELELKEEDPERGRTVLHIGMNHGILDNLLCQHLASLASAKDNYHFIDWNAARQRSQHYLDSLIINAAEKLQPDLTFIQVQAPGIVKVDIAAQIPGKVINWTGDARRPIPEWYKELAPNITMSLFSNQTDTLEMLAEGYDADFLQIGFHPQVFKDDGNKSTSVPPVIFMGNNYQDQFPLCQLRRDMVAYLRVHLKNQFQVYGNSWGPGSVRLTNPYDEAATYRSCKIAIGCSHFDLSRYSSDRLFRAMGSGAFYLTKWYPDIEVDFTPGVHLETWKTLEELQEKINFYLRNEDARKKIAVAGCELVHSRDTWAHRMEELKTLIEW